MKHAINCHKSKNLASETTRNERMEMADGEDTELPIFQRAVLLGAKASTPSIMPGGAHFVLTANFFVTGMLSSLHISKTTLAFSAALYLFRFSLIA